MLDLTAFFQGEVLAGVSDRGIDFQFPDDDRGFTGDQQDYLAGILPDNPVFTVRQVHGDRAVVAVKKDLERGVSLPEADGIIGREADLPVAVRTADCLPVFLYDPVRRAIGLVHAGWRGTRAGIVGKTLAKMTQEWGTRPEDVLAAFGPAIGSCCYEVGSEFHEHFPEDIIEREGRIFLDLPGANRRQLTAVGLRPDNIRECGICTCCRDEWFSYRREGTAAGRHLSWMMLKAV